MTQARTAWPAVNDLDLLACPSCYAALTSAHCQSCGATFPSLGEVPWLFPDPAAALGLWRNRWRSELVKLSNEQVRLESAMSASKGLAKQRLKRRLRGLRGQTDALQEILAPLLQSRSGHSDNATTDAAAALSRDADSAWYRYDANPFRDWAWGEAENAAALSQILLALTDRPQRILQIGSGAGRLAYDLHRSLRPELTLAVEHNPLLALLGAQLADGQRRKLWEFPLSPRQLDDTAVEHTLSRPHHHPTLTPGLRTVLADALTLPLNPGRFDLVVTSWFSDICPAPAAWLCETIATLLKPGGLWINHGSAAFDPAATRDCGSLDEFVSLAKTHAFTLTYQAETELPYLQSPHSRQQRFEQVGTQAFRKQGNAPTAERLKPHRPRRPNWLEDPQAPVPQTRNTAEHREASALRTFILSLVDGQRSRRDIAQQLAARGILTQADAEAALATMLEHLQD